MKTQDDKHIIKQVQKGDVAIYAVLVDKYKHMVFTLAMQIVKNEADAEEVAQDAFFKAYKALANFEGRSSFSTWIYSIAYREAISKLRKRRNKETSYDHEYDSHQNNTTIDKENEKLEQDDRTRFLKMALARMKGEEATILTLFYFEEKKVAEIAKITELTVSNVKVILHRGRQNLLAELKSLLNQEVTSLL
ncbi:MAG: RNA polymerase sigma factor [Bacteroidota bacterium]